MHEEDWPLYCFISDILVLAWVDTDSRSCCTVHRIRERTFDVNIAFAVLVLLLQLDRTKCCPGDLASCNISIRSNSADMGSSPDSMLLLGTTRSGSVRARETPFLDPGWIPSLPLIAFLVILRLLGIVSGVCTIWRAVRV